MYRLKHVCNIIYFILSSIQQDFGYGEEDIYEALETDVMGDGPPSLPPINSPPIGTIPPGEKRM